MQLDQCHNSAGSRLLCTSTLKENLKIKINLEKLRAPSEAAENIHFFHTSNEFVKISNKLAPPICHHLSPIFQPSPPQKKVVTSFIDGPHTKAGAKQLSKQAEGRKKN